MERDRFREIGMELEREVELERDGIREREGWN